MRTIVILIILAQLVSCVICACKKNSCYNNVAKGSDQSPGLSIRRADCNALFKTHVYEVTRTSTSVIVVPIIRTTTSTVTTVTQRLDTTSQRIVSSTKRSTTTHTESPRTIYTFSTNPFYNTEPKNRRAVATAMPGNDPIAGSLEIRDKLVGQGKKPAYVSRCRNLQEYATACACWGQSGSTITSTRTSYRTITSSTTLTERKLRSATKTTTNVIVTTRTSLTTSISTKTIRRTTTVQSTIKNPQATLVSRVRIVGRDLYLRQIDDYFGGTEDPKDATNIGFILAGGQPFSADNYDVKMVGVYGGEGTIDPYTRLTLSSADLTGETVTSISCKVENNGRLSCTNARNVASLLYYCNEISMYLLDEDSNYSEENDGPCVAIELELVSYRTS